MKTAQEYLKEKFPNASELDWFKPVQEALNTARIDAIKEIHGIIGAMDWDVMANTIDAKELQARLNSLINKVK